MITSTDDDDALWDIYRLMSPSGKRYIGIAKTGVSGKGTLRRWKDHKSAAYRQGGRERSKPIYCAIRKYGPETFVVDHLYTAINKREADAIERGLVAEYGTLFPLGYNLTCGGGGSKGTRASPETRAKMSARRRGKKNSPEHCARISAAKRGKLPFPDAVETLRRANLGRTFSDEHLDKLRRASTGRRFTPEQRTRLSEVQSRPRSDKWRAAVRASASRPKSPEHLAKIAAAKRGTKQSPETIARRIAKTTGQRRSPEVRQKMREAALRRWQQQKETECDHPIDA